MNIPGFSNKITYGTKPQDEPLLNYYSLSIPAEDWNKLTPEQQVAKFYAEGTKVFRNGSTLAPGATTPTPANTVMTGYNRDQFSGTPVQGPASLSFSPGSDAARNMDTQKAFNANLNQTRGALATPVTVAASNPQITLPEMFSQNNNGAGSNPLAIPNSVTMPTQTNRASTFGNNWSDFLTVAHNRQMR